MFLAFYTVDVGVVGKVLGGIKPGYAALAAVLILVNSIVAMVRFRVLLGRFGYLPEWRRLFAAFSIGSLGNQFVLNIIGQSVGRAGILTSSGVPFGATIIVTIVERIFASAVLTAAGLAAVWILLPHFGFKFAHGDDYLLSLGGGVAVVALAAATVAYERGATTRVAAAAIRGIERFWPVLLLTVLAHGLMLGGYVATLLALGLEAPSLEVVGALVIVMFAAALPISLNGWGIRELSAIAVLGAVGLEAPTALAMGLFVGVLSLSATLVFAVPGLYIALRRSRLNPSNKAQTRTGTRGWSRDAR